ncbi:MAG: ABC transporter permease [Candidatus Helarchaeota archaeon]
MIVRMRQIWVLIRKNLELYFKKGPVLVFGVLLPVFMIFAWIIGRTISPIQLFSGILGMAVFFLGTAISPVIFPWETREKNLEMTISCPITLLDLILSVTLSSMIYAVVITSIIYVFLILLLPISGWITIWFILGDFLLAWISSSIGSLISAIPTDITANIMTISSLIKFPLIFISGIFIPLSQLSPTFFYIALCSPITYFVDLLQSACGVGLLGIFNDLIILSIWGIVLFVLGYFLHRHTILKRL